MSRTLHTPGEAVTETKGVDKSSTDKPSEPISRSKYLEMHSSEVDPTTLQRAVLCKDGWVTPLPRDKDGKPQTHLVRSPGEA